MLVDARRHLSSCRRRQALGGRPQSRWRPSRRVRPGAPGRVAGDPWGLGAGGLVDQLGRVGGRPASGSVPAAGIPAARTAATPLGSVEPDRAGCFVRCKSAGTWCVSTAAAAGRPPVTPAGASGPARMAGRRRQDANSGDDRRVRGRGRLRPRSGTRPGWPRISSKLAVAAWPAPWVCLAGRPARRARGRSCRRSARGLSSAGKAALGACCLGSRFGLAVRTCLAMCQVGHSRRRLLVVAASVLVTA